MSAPFDVAELIHSDGTVEDITSLSHASTILLDGETVRQFFIEDLAKLLGCEDNDICMTGDRDGYNHLYYSSKCQDLSFPINVKATSEAVFELRGDVVKVSLREMKEEMYGGASL